MGERVVVVELVYATRTRPARARDGEQDGEKDGTHAQATEKVRQRRETETGGIGMRERANQKSTGLSASLPFSSSLPFSLTALS